MKESIIQKQIIDYLESIGAWTVKVMIANKVGCPDLLCVVDGRMVAIEVKSERGLVAPIQAHNLNKIADAGGIAIVARSVSDVMDALGKKKPHPGRDGVG